MSDGNMPAYPWLGTPRVVWEAESQGRRLIAVWESLGVCHWTGATFLPLADLFDDVADGKDAAQIYSAVTYSHTYLRRLSLSSPQILPGSQHPSPPPGTLKGSQVSSTSDKKQVRKI